MILDLINRRRRQIHLHSVIYYYLNTSIVPDALFDEWSNELVALNAKHPEYLHVGYMPSLFVDWTGDTGMHLPAHDRVIALAEQMVNQHVRMKNG